MQGWCEGSLGCHAARSDAQNISENLLVNEEATYSVMAMIVRVRQ